MDDLSIPACLDLRNPEVASKRELYRQTPVTAMPVISVDTRKRAVDEATRAFLEGEAERERIEKANSLGKLNDKKKTKTDVVLGGSFDSRTNRWITPEEDFARMAERVEMTPAELRAVFEDVAKLPDLPLKQVHAPGGRTATVDPNKDCCRAFARRILAAIDNGKLALEAEKSLERIKRRLKRKAAANAHGTRARITDNGRRVPRKRRAA